MMQLDLFRDTRDTQLRNEAVQALSRHEAAQARAALVNLAAEFGDDTFLPSLRLLVEALETGFAAPCADHAEAGKRRDFLEQTLQAAACRIFGAAAGLDWLRRFWHELATACAR